jgi:hypothetical protein
MDNLKVKACFLDYEAEKARKTMPIDAAMTHENLKAKAEHRKQH